MCQYVYFYILPTVLVGEGYDFELCSSLAVFIRTVKHTFLQIKYIVTSFSLPQCKKTKTKKNKDLYLKYLYITLIKNVMHYIQIHK